MSTMIVSTDFDVNDAIAVCDHNTMKSPPRGSVRVGHEVEDMDPMEILQARLDGRGNGRRDHGRRSSFLIFLSGAGQHLFEGCRRMRPDDAHARFQRGQAAAGARWSRWGVAGEVFVPTRNVGEKIGV